MQLHQRAARLSVSDGAHRLVPTLLQLPLASTPDIAAVVHRRVDGLYRRFRELRGEGFVDAVKVGSPTGPLERWWVTEKGLLAMGFDKATWHDEWARCRLLERLPLVQAFYQVAGSVDSMGAMELFQWHTGLCFDASVKYECGWMALFWSGLLDREKSISDHLQQLGLTLMEYGPTDQSTWPGIICFVVTDQWQRELVYRAARKAGLLDLIATWCVADGSRDGNWEPDESRGYIYQQVTDCDLGGWPWDKRLPGSIWAAQSDSSLIAHALDVILEWPGAYPTTVGAATGVTDIKRVQRVLTFLTNRHSVDRHVKGAGYRYLINSKGFHDLARRDGVTNTKKALEKHLPPWLKASGSQRHDDGVLSLAEQFMEARLPVAAGWRSWEKPGGTRGIAPDAMVFLERGPYGPGWHYIEYELTAKGEKGPLKKLRGYSSPLRQDRYPVLFVVRTDRIEQTFHRQGLERDVRLVTTTEDRLSKYGALGGFDTWSMYGNPVKLG